MWFKQEDDREIFVAYCYSEKRQPKPLECLQACGHIPLGYQDFGGIDAGLIGVTLARLGEKKSRRGWASGN